MRYADNTRNRPINTISSIHSKTFNDEQFKICFVIKKPVKIKQTLINNVFILAALILKDDRTVVFVNSDAVHSTISYSILTFKKTHTKEFFHVILD